MWRSANRRIVAIFSPSSNSLRGSSRSPVWQQPRFAQPVSSSFRLQRWLSAQAPASSEDAKVVDAEDENLGIATGLELEELLAEKTGKKRFDLEPPRGPFGTKESPAIIQSLYDERISGCSGGYAEDEHDVLWFRLKKGELHECRICSQIFKLEVVGPGGPPGGHHHH